MKLGVVVAGLYGAWALAVLTIVLAPVVFPARLEEFVGRGVPRQYYSGLAGEILASYEGVQAVAHNSGNNLRTARSAEEYGADAVEIDVLRLNGRLYASHSGPLPLFGSRVFPRPTLDQIWSETANTPVILDLKEPSSGYRGQLLDFLDANTGGRQVMVSSRSSRTLEEFQRRRPEVTRLLSVGSKQALESLAENPDTLAVIDGISVRESLLAKETIEWFSERDLIVYAWVVNDFERLNELVNWGVDGVATDNLAILELLGDRGPLQLPEIDIDRTGGSDSVASLS